MARVKLSLNLDFHSSRLLNGRALKGRLIPDIFDTGEYLKAYSKNINRKLGKLLHCIKADDNYITVTHGTLEWLQYTDIHLLFDMLKLYNEKVIYSARLLKLTPFQMSTAIGARDDILKSVSSKLFKKYKNKLFKGDYAEYLEIVDE
jgi:hypothetical protein